MEFLSSRLNTVSSQSEAYFGAGTKLTVLVLRGSTVFLQPCISVNNYDPAYFGSGTKLTVLENGREATRPTVKVLPPSEKECRNNVNKEKRKKTLLCVISGFYPDHVTVTWKINEEETIKGVATDNLPAKPNDGTFYKITSRLKVNADDWFNPNNEFQCIARFFNGKTTENVTASETGTPALKTGENIPRNITREEFLVASQVAKLSYGVLIVKGCVYGAFVMFLVFMLQGSSGKRNN